MGYHRDGEFLKLAPFETEMRRRIWWFIVMQDAKHAMSSGMSSALLPSNWDAKEPLNINDADMSPHSTEPFKSRLGPTEMAFVLMSCQICKFLISIDGAPGMESIMMGSHADENGIDAEAVRMLGEYKTKVETLEKGLEHIEKNYIDPSAGKIHTAALCIRPMLRAKLEQLTMPMRQQPEWGREIFSSKDNLFKLMVLNTEHHVDHYDQMEATGFLWFAKLHFQLDVFAVLTGQLCRRPSGSLADRGWLGVEKTYHYHPELMDMTQKQYAVQTQFTLKAWKEREKAFAAQGKSLETPAYIIKLRELSPASSDSRSVSSATPPALQQRTQHPQQVTELDQFLGGYLDVSSLNFDMWDDNNQMTGMTMSPGDFMGNSMGNGMGNNMQGSNMNNMYGNTDMLGNISLGPSM